MASSATPGCRTTFVAVLLLLGSGAPPAGSAWYQLQRIESPQPQWFGMGGGLVVASASQGVISAQLSTYGEVFFRRQQSTGIWVYTSASGPSVRVADEWKENVRVVAIQTYLSASVELQVFEPSAERVWTLSEPRAASVGWPYVAFFDDLLNLVQIWRVDSVFPPDIAAHLDAALVVPGSVSDMALDGDRLAVGRGSVAEVRAYVRTGGNPLWLLPGVLTSPNLMQLGFGTSVALSGSWLAVGAPLENRTPPRTLAVGRVYLYWLSGFQLPELKQTFVGTGAGYRLGTVVSLVDDLLLVGIPGATVDSIPGAGRVDVYEKGSDETWVRTGELRSKTPALNGEFGTSLDHMTDGAVVGAPGEDGGRGALYVFARALFRDGFESGDTSAWAP